MHFLPTASYGVSMYQRMKGKIDKGYQFRRWQKCMNGFRQNNCRLNPKYHKWRPFDDGKDICLLCHDTRKGVINGGMNE